MLNDRGIFYIHELASLHRYFCGLCRAINARKIKGPCGHINP